jgi:hypothetical protein
MRRSWELGVEYAACISTSLLHDRDLLCGNGDRMDKVKEHATGHLIA